MRRFLITSTKFTGTAEVIYNEGRLTGIDMRSTEMADATIADFKRAIPVRIENLQQAFGAGSVIVESDYELTFEEFMHQYPYKRNTHLAREYWPKMNKADQVKAYFAAIEYRKYCERNKWYNAKICETWLKKKEWLNDWKNA